MRKLQTVADMAKSGPFSEASLRWHIFNAASNGMDQAGAIVRVRRRVYLDPEGFDRWLRLQNPAPSASADAGEVRP